jgi:Domain of unknown function (DUF6457)
VNPFFDDLGRRWMKAAAGYGAELEPPTLAPRVAEELLELARVTAHTEERRFAPLACFTAGLAMERLRTSRPDLDDSALVACIREVRTGIEADYAARAATS